MASTRPYLSCNRPFKKWCDNGKSKNVGLPAILLLTQISVVAKYDTSQGNGGDVNRLRSKNDKLNIFLKPKPALFADKVPFCVGNKFKNRWDNERLFVDVTFRGNPHANRYLSVSRHLHEKLPFHDAKELSALIFLFSLVRHRRSISTVERRTRSAVAT